MKFRKILALAVSAVAASALAVSASAYTAGIDIKLDNWSHRNSLNMSTGMYAAGEDGDMEAIPGWKVSDVTFDKDGQYTCSVEFGDMADGKDGAGTYWKVVKLETSIEGDAENPDKNPTITIDKLVVDGKEIADAKNAVQMVSKPERSDDWDDQEILNYTTDYINVELYNEWNKDSKYISPTDSFGHKLEITFTVSGLGGGDETSAAGDVNQPTTDKNSPDTGVEGVAVVAGLAVIAAGAVVVIKKRK